MQEQLEKMDQQEIYVALPKVGKILESQVRVCIEAGLVELKKHIREATVRRNVVVQLIRMLKERGHPDYQKQNMDDVELRAKELTDSDDPAIPNGLLDVLEGEGDDGGCSDAGREGGWV